MQSETNSTDALLLDGNKKIKILRPDIYSRKLTKNLLLFLLLPVSVITLTLPLIYMTPLVLLIPAIVIPVVAFLCFVGVKSLKTNYILLSGDGLEYHEGSISYESSWDNLKALKEARIGFRKICGVELVEEVSFQISDWSGKLSALGEILAILTFSTSPSPVGSRYVKGGKFFPVELFAEPDAGYDAEVWQLIARKAPWLFDEEAAAARAKRVPTGWAKLRQPLQ